MGGTVQTRMICQTAPCACMLLHTSDYPCWQNFQMDATSLPFGHSFSGRLALVHTLHASLAACNPRVDWAVQEPAVHPCFMHFINSVCVFVCMYLFIYVKDSVDHALLTIVDPC